MNHADLVRLLERLESDRPGGSSETDTGWHSGISRREGEAVKDKPTEQEILDQVVAACPRHFRPWALAHVLAAYRLGWEARGKHDEEVCRDYAETTKAHRFHTEGALNCAAAISRKGDYVYCISRR